MAIQFSSDTNLSIEENLAANAIIYTAVAEDTADPAATFTYSLAAGSDPALTINSITGEVTLTESPDYETQRSYEFTVVATAADGVTTVERSIVVAVADVAEALSGGTAGDDSIIGTIGSDVIAASSGNDSISGGLGLDTVTYSGNRDDYEITVLDDGRVQVADLNDVDGNEGVDLLSNVEVLQFADKSIEIVSGLAFGGDERVNTYTTSTQQLPSVSALSDGGYVVVWQSSEQDGSAWGVYGQRYDSLGEKVGSEFRVNTTTASSQYEQDIAGLSDGGFIVTWTSPDENGSGAGVFSQRFDALGNPVGGEEIINLTTSNTQSQAVVAGLQDGGYVVAWVSQAGEDGWGAGILMQRFDAAGLRVGDVVIANEITIGDQVEPSIAVLSGGELVVTWSNSDSTNWWGVHAQIFDGALNPIGGNFQVNQFTDGQQRFPDVAPLSEGGFVISWSSENQDGSGWGVYASTYDATGAVISSESLLNEYTYESQLYSTVTGTSDGGFIAAWQSWYQDQWSYGAYSAEFDAFGNQISAETRLNTSHVGQQRYPVLSTLESGSVVAVWESESIDPDWAVMQSFIAYGVAIQEEGIVVGSENDDVIVTNSGNDVIVGGFGNDRIDGGSGYNTYRVIGTPDAFMWQVNSSGELILEDMVADVVDPINGSNEGVDTLTNIQSIEFVNPETSEVITIELDDYGNAPDDTNLILEYGQIVSGRFNFKGDADYFQIESVSGTQVRVTSYVNNSPNEHSFSIGNQSTNFGYRQGEINSWSTALNQDGLVDIFLTHLQVNPAGSSSPQASQPYSFVVRRVLDGSSAGETLEAGSNYEWINAGAGNDTIIGSERSDALYGEDGNDVITGGGGNDVISGGAGTANVAIFSGARSEYVFNWEGPQWNPGHNEVYLQVTDTVDGRDGVDRLYGVQILRFADGDIVLDAESNVRTTQGFSVGQTITGTLPLVNGNDNYERYIYPDTDWFQQIFTPSVGPNTVLRIRFEGDPDLQGFYSGELQARFYATGSNDTLIFTDQNGNDVSELQINPRGSNEYYLSPTRFESGGDFAALYQRLDVQVWGRVAVQSGSLDQYVSNYSLTIDIVMLGDDSANTLIGDGNATFLDGKGGDDVITGSAIAETLQGGAGTDTLDGGAGNDRLVDADFNLSTAAADSYLGGAGNDEIDLRKSTFLNTSSGQGSSGIVVVVDGGEESDGSADRDTLILSSADVNWDLLDVSNVEVLEASGTSSATASELLAMGFEAAYGMTFVVADGVSEDFSGLAGQYSIQAGAGSTIIGNADGVEVRVTEAGANFTGGDGDDTIRLTSYQMAELGAIPLASGSYAGGLGTDTLHLDVYGAIDLSQVTLSGIERLTGIYGQTEVSLTIDQLLGLTRVDNIKTVVIVGGGAIDLAELAARNVTQWRMGDDQSYTITGTDSADTLNVQDANYTASLGAGDDMFEIAGSYASNSANSLDGGVGTDTLLILSGDVDLSGVTLTDIESIVVSSSSLAMTDQQWQDFGGIVTRTEGATTQFILSLTAAGEYAMAVDSPYYGLLGSTGDDTLTGSDADNALLGNSGNDTLLGLGGADRIVTGAGQDTVDAGAGDDTIEITNKTVVTDSIEGGDGTDVLIVQDGQDLTGASISGIETLKGSGRVVVTQAQLEALTTIDGLTVVVADQDGEYQNGSLVLRNGARVLSDRLVGGEGSDSLVAPEGDQTIAGGAGNDSIDGGSGYNTYEVLGTPDAFIWQVNDSGQIVLEDIVVDETDLVNGSNEGTDTLVNIQSLSFKDPVSGQTIEIQLDDFGNDPDSGNRLIRYGEVVSGRFNFKGDDDYFLLDVVDGTEVRVTSYINYDNNYHGFAITGSGSRYFHYSQWDQNAWSITLNGDGLQDVRLWHGYPNPANSASPQASQSYSFVIRRVLNGTATGETLEAGDNYEWINAGAGNDIIIGSSRSDALFGEDGNDIITGGGGNDSISGGAGTANVAVFSGVRSEYGFSWENLEDQTTLVIQDLVAGRDGRDYLRGIQILRFADGDVVLDAESNVRTTTGVAIGQSIEGSLPVTTDWREIDQDWFQQIFTPAVGPDTVIRVRFEGDSGTEYRDGYIYARFYATGSNDTLIFTDANNPNQTYTEFQINPSSATEYYVSPTRFSSGGDFAALYQRLDVQVWGVARNGNATLGDLSDYSITIDIVMLGDDSANTLTGDGNATFLDGKGGDDVITGSAIAETLQGGAGTDTLDGGAGNDRLVDADFNLSTAAADSYSGGAGNDEIDLRKSTFLNTSSGQGSSGIVVIVDGGEESDGSADRDTLILSSADVNWDLLDVSNVEVLEASGTSSATASELLALGFEEAYGMTFVVADGVSEDFSGLAGQYSIQAGAGSTIIGNADGVEVRVTEAGANFTGGDGDDTIRLTSYQMAELGAIPLASGSYAGGLGTDILHLDVYGAIDLSQVTLSGIERLTGIYGQTEVSLTIDQVLGLTRVDNIKTVVIVGGGAIDLAELAARNVTQWRLGDDQSYTITGTDSADTLNVQDANYTASLGAGDDVFEIAGSYASNSANSLDGGAGTDTLRILSGDVDLSGVTLTDIESIVVSSSSLAMTDQQWQDFGGIVTRTEGATTQFILSLTAAGEYAMAVDSPFLGLSGSAGADRLIGNINDDVLSGGAGNDYLDGAEGNDRLVAGAGIDTLVGGTGNDILDIAGKVNPIDTLDGGAGTDTLVVSDGQDLSGLSLNSVEVLRGTGVVYMTTEQLNGFELIDNLTVQLTDVSDAYVINPTLVLGGNSSILLPDVDESIIGNSGILGSGGSDDIWGTDFADVIYGGQGADELHGLTGNDTLIGGKGVDTLYGDAGNDTFMLGGVGIIETSYTRFYSDKVYGGAGNDTLVINLNGLPNYNQVHDLTYEIVDGAVSGIENLIIENFSYRNNFELSAATWSQFESVTVLAKTDAMWEMSLILSGDGESIDFAAVDAGSAFRYVTLNGAFDQIDLTRNPATVGFNGVTDRRVTIGASFTELLGSSGDDAIYLQYSANGTIDLAAGDDLIVWNGGATTIIGGDGFDTIRMWDSNGFYDLTAVNLIGVETLQYSTSTIVLTQAQVDSLDLDGSGRVYVLDNGVVTGTGEADSYSGNGFGVFEGGSGNDSISNITTAVFTGNQADYDWDRNGSSLTIQHSRGTLLDGTDTLNGVMEMRFADSVVILDDAPDQVDRYIDPWTMGDASEARSSLNVLEYGKRESYKHDFNGDNDVFTMTLVPNSPLSIEASTANGNTVYFRMWDAVTGAQIHFKNPSYNWVNWEYTASGFGPSLLPVVEINGQWVPYEGGEVVVQVGTYSDVVEDYAFTINYQDDYAGSVDTLGQMDPQDGVIQGYIGDIGDSDWIRTELIAGTKYEFSLAGLSSGGGTLVDPKLELRDDQGRLIENGIDIVTDVAGTDDTIVFRPTVTGTYYLSVSDIIGQSKGSWTLTQGSLDTIAGNVSTTERAEFDQAGRFRIESEINQLSDHDWFKVWLDKGVTYRFTMDGTSLGGTLDDPQLSIRSVTGRLLSQDDNGGTGTNAELYFSAPDSGWYYIDAGASGNGSKGTYILKGSSVQDDYDNTILTEGTIGVDVTERGIVSYLGDSDWFKAGLSAGVTYVITLEGDISEFAELDPLTDPLLIIRDEQGRIIQRVDDFDGTLNATAFFRAPAAGVYFFEVRSAFKYDIGSYALNLSLAPPDDHGSLLDDTATAIAIDTNFSVSQQGIIGIPGDKDVFAITLEAGKVYLLSAEGMAGNAGTLADPLLRLFSTSGRLVDYNDNGGLGNDAQFYFAPTETGVYYLQVSSADRDAMGSFTLSVAERNMPSDDVPSDISTDVVLIPGQSFEGELLLQNDQDWFAIDLQAGESYVFRALASRSGNGSLEDPVLELRDDTGAVVRLVDNMLVGNEPAFEFTPSASGRYYLVVRASDGQTDTGSYVLSTRAPDDHGNTQADATVVGLGEVVAGGVQYNDGEFGVRAQDSVGLATDFDEDWFAFEGVAGQVLSFNVEIAPGSTLSRPMVEVVDAQGRVLAVGDGLETDNGLAAAAFFVPTTGTYYARVIDGAGAEGDYIATLTLGDASDEDSNGPVSLVFSSQGEITQASQTAVIGLTGDTDTYEVSLQAGHSYRIETVAIRDGSTAPLPSATLDMAFTPTGAGRQIDGLSQTIIDNGDGTFTLELRVAEAVRSDWAQGLDSFDVAISFDDAVFGQVLEADVLVADGSVAAANVETDGSIAVSAFFYPEKFDVLADQPLVSITFRAPTGDLSSASVSIDDVIFDTTTIEPISQETSPSFFDEGFITADADGVLSITVAPLEATQTGQYRLRIIDLGTEQADDHIDFVADYDVANGVLAINENAAGKIDASGDVDLFAVNLTAGNIYDFSVKSYLDGLGSLAQAQLRILNAEGQLVSVGTYDGVTGRTELSIAVFEDGRYFLEVSAVDVVGNIGTYTLDTRLRGSSADIQDDYADNTLSSAIVGPGVPLSGEIETPGDRDWARVTLEAGKVYVLDVLADGDGAGGTLTDAVLRLYDADGNEIAYDDNTGAGLDAHIQFTPSVSGDYYLDVSGRGAAVGTYTLRVRELYSGVADPLASAQWYIDQVGITELNGQYTGAGVTVGVIDDGIDMSHPDLQENMNFALSYDTQFNTQDGNPKYRPIPFPPFDDHGTQVAGIIGAVQNNETGIVGASPDVDLVSTRVKWSWGQITEALSLQWQFDVSNNSWGAINPFADNFNSTALTFAWVSIRKGVEEGRNGLGTVFVFSAGNGAAAGENTNYHNFQNAREVITVGAANQDDTAAAFSTPGASVLVSTYGVGMITTDRHQPGWGVSPGDYSPNFSGTSASAPLVSGVVALMLEANPDLGYRDVQEILAYSARHPDVQDWKQNGASNLNLGGLSFNDKAGFGLVDAYAAVQLASTWTETSTAVNEVYAGARQYGLVDAIPDGTGQSYTMTFEIDANMTVEHVELGIDLRHERMGDLVITITSPDGTTSTLMNRPTVTDERPFGLSGQDSGVPTHLLWDFSSVQFWGEQASGTWTVTITDVRAEQTGTVQSLSLRLYGDRDDGNDTYVFTDEGFQAQTEAVLEDESGVDTINASPVRYDTYIDLTDGIIAANTVTYGIADWTVVENAISGRENDRLVGNEADNTLNAGDGNDVLEGRAGNDTLLGGGGQDTAVYAGARAEYTVSWDPDTDTITVIDNKASNGDEGIDTLTGIERLVFSDAEMTLGEMVGNTPPVANTTFFDTPVYLNAGVGIDYQLPDNAFTDADGDSADLTIEVADAAGGELPDWLTYDETTGTFVGVPPEDYQGQLKLEVTAIDEFGESTSEILTLQFGDNQAPIVDDPSELVVNEDSGLTLIGLTAPVDPEATDVLVTILDLPSIGQIIDKAGNPVAVGSVLTADEFSELHYLTSLDANGDAGYLRYQAADADGVVSESSVHVFVDADNDAPRFVTESGSLVINYPEQTEVTLDLLTPSDPESELTTVTIIGLPELGAVSLDGTPVSLDQVLTFDQLNRLVFTLNENVNGPIGGVTIQAVDPEGAATNWSLNLEVQGDSASTSGTAGDDDLYGSTLDDVLYGNGGNDTIAGNAGNDRLLGGLGNDTLLGGRGDDQLDGSAGNDYLDGGAGNDVMAGGPGHDTYIVDDAGDIVLEVIGGGAGGDDLIVTSLTMSAPENVESLQAAAGAVIDLTGNSLDNTIVGNDEANTLLGGAGRDNLVGKGGNDVLDGGTGVDAMAGGDGDDVYYVDAKADRVLENANAGMDSVIASSSYTLPSNVENLTLTEGGDYTAGGNSLDNHLVGNSGNNVLAGGVGADILEGGLGDDTYILSDYLDTIIDTGGIDTIRSALDVTLPNGIENAQLVGVANTVAIGNGADNQLTGNMADNILDGGAGVDTLTGGEGDDQFILSSNGLGAAVDIVTDFQAGSDLLVIDLASFGLSPEALGLLSSGLVSADSFVVGAGAVALDANDFFIYDTATGILKFDADGNGEGEAIEIGKIQLDEDSGPLTSGDVFVAI